MVRTKKSEIESELHRLAELIGAQPNQLPSVDDNQDFARPNIAFSSNGILYYEAYEPGEQLFSISAFDLEHLMFVAFKDTTFIMAVEHERKNRKSNEDFRRQLFSKQVELMRIINSDWAKQTQKEIDETLRTTPFDD
ncbi:Immunity protein 63 [Marivirga sericea]|uniref:Immunity protein 63 n=1 Tax=Marivirga sericea TaxID=1028 RepID=A0A1X7J340_9BACT|nr:Imm63 family immunity protein [Marivirga sericea]SMG22033.1 Immunity protein 63 [Marivirga sericea]